MSLEIEDNDLNPGVQVSAVTLHKLEFERLGGGKPPDEPATPVEVSLGIAWVGGDLGVELGVEVEIPEVLRSNVVYRGVFKKAADAKGDDESFWKGVAARLAPIVVYPYVRETLHAMASRAGLPPTILPVINIGGMFKPGEIELPAREEDGSGVGST